jgi:hypothetical protein
MLVFMIIGPEFIKLIGIRHSILGLGLISVIGVIYFFEKALLNYTTIICVTGKVPMYKSFVISSLIIILFQIVLVNKFDTNILSIILPQLLVQISFNYWFWTWHGIKMINSIKCCP